MIRVIAALGAALVATLLILGPGPALVTGTARVQLPAATTTQPSGANAVHADASAAGPVVSAAARPGPNAARVTLTARPADKLTQGYVLGIRLATPDGKPLNETAVTYYEVVDLFGPREMLIGTATTDGQGEGSLLYLPAQLGPHQIVARSSGKGQVTWGEGRMSFDAQVAAAPYRVEPPPLAAFSALLPYGVGAIVLFVWVLLAFALLATARGVVAGARDHAQGKGDPA